MKTKSFLFLAIIVTSLHTNAEEKILDCSGTWEQEGMNLPPHAKDFVDKKKSEVVQQYLVHDNSITVLSGNSDIKNDTIKLCSKSDATYLYAWDCNVTQPRLMAVEWTQEDNPIDKNSKFHKKWVPRPDSIVGAKVIYVDRVNLYVTDDDYAFHMSTDDDENGKPLSKAKNYVIVDHTKLQCRIAKPKL